MLIQGKRGKPPFVSPASVQSLEKSLITRQAGTWRRSLLSQQKTPVRKKMSSLNPRKDANATFYNAWVEPKLRKTLSPRASAAVEARTSVVRICKRYRTQERRARRPLLQCLRRNNFQRSSFPYASATLEVLTSIARVCQQCRYTRKDVNAACSVASAGTELQTKVCKEAGDCEEATTSFTSKGKVRQQL